MKKNENKAISSEVAFSEFKKFLEKYKSKEIRRGSLTDEKIKEEFIDALEAVEDGLLTFDDKNNPNYKLRVPIETESKNKELGTYEVGFRTRIRPTVKADLMDGLEVKKQAGKFALRYIAYITQLPIPDLDNMDPDDYDTINQICSVF